MTAASVASLLTAAAVLAAFRLPALMMFRGIRSPFALRRPIMIVRMPAPMSRSMPIAPIPQQSTLSTLAPSLPVSLPPLRAWPPPPFPLPQISQPSVSRAEQPQPPLNFTPQPTHFKQVLVPTPHQNLNHDLKITSINNRPFYRHYPKYHFAWSTTPKPNELPFHYIFRPLSQGNKKWKTPREYFTMSTTTVSNNHLSNHNEDRRYGMMFPIIPRNFKSDILTDESTTTNPSITETTSQSTIPTTTQRRVTKVRLKSMTKSFKEKNIENNSSTENSMQTNATKMLTSVPNMMSNKTRIVMKRIRIKTTIPTDSTVMTPAPIENYKPVKARVTEHKINEIMKQLMFDESKNLYYYVTLRSI